MKYRTLGRTGLRVSEISLGCEGYNGKNEAEILELINTAVESGVNFFDLLNPEPKIRTAFGKAMRGRREKFILQGHICTGWVDEQYKRTRDIEVVKRSYDDLFRMLDAEYIDIGMVHYIDEQKDFDEVFNGPVMQYAKQLRAEGKIRHIGISTHNQQISLEAAKSGLIDVIMLSVNPAYDMLPPEEDCDLLFEKSTYDQRSALNRIDPQRDELYRYCEEHGVAISVMKAFAGGALLSESESPFGVAMTVPQCLHYCLTRPGVATVLAGAHSVGELLESVAYSDLPEEKKDFATVLSSAPAHSFSDKCMYCGHCAPCTVGIDIATVNKFADLCIAQKTAPETVREHYEALNAHAGDCIACCACEANCPFGVKIVEHMRKAREIFGK